MFIGEYSHTLDGKNRMMLPAKFRDTLGTEIVIAKSLDPCLSVYRMEDWMVFYEKLNALPNIETRRVKRFFLSSAFETSVDSQGRILVPAELCKYAGLTKDVTVAGVGDHLELWSPENWVEDSKKENEDKFAETLTRLGL